MKPAVAPVPSLVPAPFGTLQRNCACGASGASGGECAECKKKNATLQRQAIAGAGRDSGAFTEPSFGHDFAHVRVHAGSEGLARESAQGVPIVSRGSPSLFHGWGSAATRRLFQVAPGTGGGGGALCHNGGGDSSCDESTGEYKITGNYNTCCTRDCTQQHEQVHVQDLGACCKAFAAAKRTSANPSKVQEMYSNWMKQAEPITQCNAYTHDVKCATAMEKAQDCNGKGKGSACCLSIEDYLTTYSDQAKVACKTGSGKLPDCPNFGLATLLP